MFAKLKEKRLNERLSNLIRDTEDLFIDKVCKELKIKDIDTMSKQKEKAFLNKLLSYSKSKIIKGINTNDVSLFKLYKINLNKIDKEELKNKVLNYKLKE